MKKINIFIVLTIVLTSLFSIKLNAQEKTEGHKQCSNMSCCSSENKMDMNDSTKMMHKNNKMMMSDSTKEEMMHHKMHNIKNEKASIIREGEIDLSKIDMNKDGKVYQDQMCWNVISDEAGRCPKCNMKLKEVSLEQAKKNLVENGFKTKK